MPQCIRCGRTVDLLVDGRLCKDCYLETYGLGVAPKRIELTVCTKCGSFRYEGRWLPPPSDGLEGIVGLLFQARFKPGDYTSYYRVEHVEMSPDADIALVSVSGYLKTVNEEVEVEYSVPVIIKKQVCPICIRKASGAPTAIVQVRGYDGRLSPDEKEAVHNILSSLGESVLDFIISIDDVREGIDIKMVDHAAARTLAAKLRSILAAKVKESHKVIGQRNDGRRVSRLTLSVRLPFFTKGSIVGYKNRLAIVEDVKHGYVAVRLLGTKKMHRLRSDDAWNTLEPPGYDDEKHVIIAALEPGWIHLQSLDKGMEYLELRHGEVTIEGRVEVGKYARLLLYKGKYYLLIN